MCEIYKKLCLNKLLYAINLIIRMTIILVINDNLQYIIEHSERNKLVTVTSKSLIEKRKNN